MAAFNELLSSVMERGARLIEWRGSERESPEALGRHCAELLTSKGEATGVALAARILDGYGRLAAEGRRAFFELLARHYDLDLEALEQALARYGAERTPEALTALTRAAEPRRQELFRRLNLAPGGTRRLVGMRADLLALMNGTDGPAANDPATNDPATNDPATNDLTTNGLARIDGDFRHLLMSWFNRGFLTMQPIDWHTPAAILEKIIAYEAVHQIDSWEELRRRVQPEDRRCFAFFHPSMPDEPLVFVEVALTREVPGSIGEVLTRERDRVDARDARTAVFYSISNCQKGLRGVSFGAFLIKQVASDLARDLPRLETFVTLSPVPGFARWLAEEAERDPDLPAGQAMALIRRGDWREQPRREAELKGLLLPLAARYLLSAKRGDGLPVDPVARFHLGNGASLLDIHWMGDTSEKGLAQSFGVMVNYLYDLDRVEENHEAYAAEGKVAASRRVRGLAGAARKGAA